MIMELLQDWTDFKFDTQQNLIWPARQRISCWRVELPASSQSQVILEWGWGTQTARQFTAVTSTPLGQMQYDEFWVLWDQFSQQPLIRSTVTVNNMTDSTRVITQWSALYVIKDDMTQLTATVGTAHAVVQLHSLGIRIGT
jgi:hypothetical protein